MFDRFTLDSASLFVLTGRRGPAWFAGAYAVLDAETHLPHRPLPVTLLAITGASDQDGALSRLEGFIRNETASNAIARQEVLPLVPPRRWSGNRPRESLARRGLASTVGIRRELRPARAAVRLMQRRPRAWAAHLELVGPRLPSDARDPLVVSIQTARSTCSHCPPYALLDALDHAAPSLELDIEAARLEEPPGHTQVTRRIIGEPGSGLAVMSAYFRNARLTLARIAIEELTAVGELSRSPV